MDNGSWSSVIRFGGSLELLAIIIIIVFLGGLVGIIYPLKIAKVSDTIDNFVTRLGQGIAWLALLLVVQQLLIVFAQAIFKFSSMSFGPYLPALSASPQWFSEQLRLYNALLIVLGAGYTMVAGGHVRVDLLYGNLTHRTKRLLDLIGSIILLIPFTLTLWYFGWFYMWRSISSSSVNLFRDIIKFRNWKLESSTNPSGFEHVYLFKILIPLFAILMFLTAVSIIYRSIAALRDQRYLDSLAEPGTGH